MGKCALTGASGFVGSHTATALLSGGWDVTALLRGTSSTESVPGRCSVSRVDFMETGSVATAMDGADLIIHSAAAVKARSQEEFDRANALVVRKMLDARQAACPDARFIFVSSEAVSGPEGSAGPVTAYGRSKLLGEIAVRDSLNWVIVRPPAVFGPGDRASASMFRMASRGVLVSPWTRGLFSMIYVEDLARLLVMLGEAAGVEGGMYRPSYGRLFSWKDLHSALEEAAGRRILHLRVPPALVAAAAFTSEIASTVAGACPFFTRDKCRELLADSWHEGENEFSDLPGWRPELTLVEALRRTLADTGRRQPDQRL